MTEQNSRTALMLEIESLEAELEQARQIMALHSETISQMAEQLKVHSGVFHEASTLSELDFLIFKDARDKYAEAKLSEDMAMRCALKDFFVYKLGIAYGQSYGKAL